jgi:hypothetical protein
MEPRSIFRWSCVARIGCCRRTFVLRFAKVSKGGFVNADAFRHFYDYHLNENRKIWSEYVLPLTQAQFTQPVA